MTHAPTPQLGPVRSPHQSNPQTTRARASRPTPSPKRTRARFSLQYHDHNITKRQENRREYNRRVKEVVEQSWVADDDDEEDEDGEDGGKAGGEEEG